MRKLLFLGTVLFAAPHAHAAAPSSHPLQPALECRTESRSSVQAKLYIHDGGSERLLGTFTSIDPTGSCELASRNARDGKVCITSNYTVTAINIATGASVGTYGSDSTQAFNSCFAAVNPERRATRQGYVEFITADRLTPFKSRLPRVENTEVQAVLNDSRTMWYDELSMIFTYQDSQGDPKGLRGNRVGWDVGTNASEPDIHKLVDYFEPEHFRAPFKTAAGTTLVNPENSYLLNFWRLPEAGGATVPVKYWHEGDRWRWTFPIGTYFGEVLFQKAPDDGSWYVYEIRTRKRYAAGWAIDVFRPFPRATDLATAIRAARPSWESSADLAALVAHLERTDTLVEHTLTSTAVYDAVVPPIRGALDYIPETRDFGLIKQLLSDTTFRSADGAIWKENGTLEAYAASTHADFSIVPKDYEMGVIPVNETSCGRCHNQTGRELGDLDGRIVLYGEMWGEDRIFTWHLFDANFDSFTVSDGSRRVNQRLVTAGLVQEGQPAGDARYGAPLGPER